jgi:hypothetical protein
MHAAFCIDCLPFSVAEARLSGHLIILSLIESGEVEVEDFDTDARS